MMREDDEERGSMVVSRRGTTTKGTATTARQTQVVFIHLDPFLKTVLELTTKFKHLAEVEDDDITTITKASSSVDDEEWIQTISSLVRALEDLQKAIKDDLGPTFAPSLVVLADYISLPLTAIFHVEIDKDKDDGDDNRLQEEDYYQRRKSIHRDYLFKLYTTTAKLMSTYVQISTTKGENSGEVETPQASSRPTTSLSVKHLKNYLIALATILPEQQQRQKQGPRATKGSLNDKSDLWLVMLDTFQEIFAAISFFNNSNAGGENQLVQVWNGALVARIVDGISSLLLNENSNNDVVHLHVLATLNQLLTVTTTPIPSSSDIVVWRSIFPGIFIAIYKRLLQVHRQTSSGHSIKIECQGLQLLSKLFKSTMVQNDGLPPSAKEESSITTTPASTTKLSTTKKKLSAVSMLAQLQERNSNTVDLPSKRGDDAGESSSTKQQSSDQLSSTTSTTEQPRKKEAVPSYSSFAFFEKQVHQRIVAPLTVLLRQSSVSTSPDVRQCLLDVCKVLLVETNDFWSRRLTKIESLSSSTSTSTSSSDGNQESTITELSMDLCLIMESDKDEQVVEKAMNILDEYRTQMQGNHILQGTTSQQLVSKILDKIDRLPTLAQGSKTLELRNELHLVTGYLRALGANNGSVALSSSVSLRRSLVSTMDIGLESTSGSTATTIVSSSDRNSTASASLKFRYLNTETESAASSLLQMLGTCLGHKHGAIVVDGLIADMFESFDTTQQRLAFTMEWMHQWIGSLVVANKILRGAFEGTSTNRVESDHKSRKRLCRVLKSLASSILPLVCESELWSLPTQDISLFLPMSFTRSLPTTRILQANECMVVLMIDLVSSFCTLLQSDGDKFWPALLISLADKAHQLNSPRVQNAAHQCLQKLALIECGNEDSEISVVVAHGLSSLVANMISQLRLSGGIRVLQSLEFDERVLWVSSFLRWVMDMLAQSLNLREVDNVILQEAAAVTASSILDLMKTIISRVDSFHLNKQLTDPCTQQFHFLYRTSLEYLLAYWGAKTEQLYTYQMEAQVDEPAQPWFELLSPYRKASFGFESSGTSPDRIEGCSGLSSGDRKDSLANDDAAKKKTISQREINFVSLIVSRGCLFLSYDNLNVKVTACESLQSAFKFLAFISNNCNDPNDELNKIKNSILQQVASSWPAIKARLMTISDELNTPSGLMSLLNIQKKSTKRDKSAIKDDGVGDASKRVFLARLFTLVATMSECSGEFMADRFKTDVWKIAVLHLRSNLRDQENSSATLQLEQPNNEFSTPDATSITWNVPSSERLLFQAIIDCIRRVFQQRECAAALSAIMESVGTVLLPYLEHDDEDIRLSISQILKSILSLDCDVLRRPLLSLSGRGIPRMPELKNLRQPSSLPTYNRANSIENLCVNSRMSRACEDLLRFVDTLPEQKIN